ncbi:MAG: hypothetical protein JXR73_21140 [Candidatus Omnitrophica bacterium]|nr:hypothetical protein [Candidatus Omnitrophota bacterium]
MDVLTLVPRLPFFSVLLLYALVVWALWIHYQKTSRRLWGGRYYFLNRAAVSTLLFLLMLHPSREIQHHTREKKILAIVQDASSSFFIADENEKAPIQDAYQLLTDPQFIDYFKSNFEIHWHRFDVDVQPVSGPIGEKSIDSPGALSRIGHALHTISSRLSPDILAGIVLVTDGSETGVSQNNTLPSAPVYPIGVGSDHPRPICDREIQDVIAPPKVTVKSQAKASVFVRSLGLDDSSIPITLSLADESGEAENVVASATAAVSHAGQSALCSVDFIPEATGRFRFIARVPLHENEMLPHNNERSIYIDVVDPDIPVLYLEGSPRFEFKFLKRALEEDEFIQPTNIMKIGENRFFVQIGDQASQETTRPAADFSQYKVIVLGDVGPEILGQNGMEDLLHFVEDGGGLLFWGSKNLWAALGSASTLQPLLPIQDGAPSIRFSLDSYTLSVSRLGRNHPMFSASLSDQEEPQVQGALYFSSLKPAASILAHLTQDQVRIPGVITQRYGRGRVAIMAGLNAWQWELQQGIQGNKTTFFHRFWRQSVRWLAGLEDEEYDMEEPLIVRTDQYDYYVGEPVIMTAMASRQYFETPPSITAHCLEPIESTLTMALDRSFVPGPYRYSYEFNPTKPGRCTFQIQAHPGGQEDAATVESTLSFEIKESACEWEQTTLNDAYLKQLARQTGGQYYPLSQAMLLQRRLSEPPETKSRLIEYEFWQNPWLMSLIGSLLCLEWGIRRRYERLKPEDKP